jgi:hypothetical protein
MPYDVDCSWIEDRELTLGGTGAAAGVGASESEQYLSAFYFAIVTVTGVGYGDILPETGEEKKFVVGAIMFGAFLYAYIIGDFSNLLKNLSQERDKFDEKMRSVNDLLGYIDVDPATRMKVQNFYDFKFLSKEGSASIIDELPTAIQTELIQQKYSSLIEKVPFFATLQTSAVVDLCRAMVPFTVSPGDFILEKGEWNQELLILSKGTARTPGKDGNGNFTTFDVGAFWGEMQFLGLTQQRSTSVVADLYCEVVGIKPQSILPGTQAHRNLMAYGNMRAEMQKKTASGETVDMAAMKLEFDRAIADDEEEEEEMPTPSARGFGAKAATSGRNDAAVMGMLAEMQDQAREMNRQRAEHVASAAELEKMFNVFKKRIRSR